MNPKNLRAGKAVDETDPSPLLPGSYGHTSSPPEVGKPNALRTAPIQFHKVLPFLFEGDEPPKPAETALTQKFELGDQQQSVPNEQEAKLPDAYGTGKLLLSARDPHALFAHWDLTKEQQDHYNSLSADGHLTLRAYAPAYSNQPAAELPVNPEGRHLFLNIEHAGTSYVGELGYYRRDRQWKTIATSAPTTTPPDAPSTETSVVFSTPQARNAIQSVAKSIKAPAATTEPSVIPVSGPRWPFEPVAPEDEPSASMATPQEPLPEDAPPFVKRGVHKKWTSVQERLLAEMIRISFERREWISSVEIVNLVHQQIELLPNLAPSPLSLPEMPGPVPAGVLVNISSPIGEQPGRKGFWFNINAELVVYGATEPDAQVTIAGRPIKLRPDGTFTCHFALPDGDYALAATAVSPENEQRQAELDFSRHTTYSAELGSPQAGSAHPQNPSLEPLPPA